MQFLQPQRLSCDLRDICAALESQIECLVGCNAYLTPKNTQGLAPHHDDVELLICQTQGRKAWKLYNPLNGFALPNAPSEDLDQESIGDPIMEVVLDVGDVLYMPKGTIHQALAQNEDSVHLTISTYQQWTWGDLASAVLDETLSATSEPVCLPLSLREELPFGFLSSVGEFTGTADGSKMVATELAKKLRDLADAVEQRVEIVQAAADTMAYDFLTSRMPPMADCSPPQEDPPKLDDRIKLDGKSYFRLLSVRFENGLVDDSVIQIVSCLTNDPQTHMMQYPKDEDTAAGAAGMDVDSEEEAVNTDMHLGGLCTEAADDGSLVFSMDSKRALLQIFHAANGVLVRDLRLSTDQLCLELSRALWEHGIIVIM